jgi:hypothetical protein
MLSDPRIGLIASLVVVLLAMGWLAGQWLFSDSLFAVLGYAEHAITLLSIFLGLAGSAVALLFRRFHRVRTDLLAGRNVIARWTVDPQLFRTFAAVADKRDREDKQGALLMVLVFIVVIFGAFALFDLEAAPAMLSMAAAVALAVVLAFLFGNRVRRKQLEPRSGDIIVGTDGVLVNGVLHVWSAFLTWLRGATLEPGPPAILTIDYAFLARYGVQEVAVMLPVPPGAEREAENAVRRLNEAAGVKLMRRRRGGRGPAPRGA